MAGPESLFVSSVDGTRLHVRRVGSGLPPCILIHGFADAGYVWDGFMRSAMTTQTLLSVDLRGHGDSGWDADGRYDSARLVDDIGRIIDTLDLQGYVLVGHSLGGNVALRVAATRPGQVAGIAVIDTPPQPSAKARTHLLAELAGSANRYRSIDEFATLLAPRRPQVSPKLVRHIAEHALRRLDDGAFAFKADPRLGRLLDADDDGGLLPILRRINCPVLIVRGAQSGVLTQQDAEQMARETRHGRLQVVAAAGHSVMLDNPTGFRDAVAPFIKSFAAPLQRRA